MTHCCFPLQVRRHASVTKIVTGLLGFLLSAFSALAAPVNFDIAAQPAPAAVRQFITQSGRNVVYNIEDLRAVTTHGVKGTLEPRVALDRLLDGSGLVVTDSGKGYFLISKAAKVAMTGSIRGSLSRSGGGPAEGARVVIHETGKSVGADKGGEFFFESVEPGRYVLEVQADGYQPLHMTDVVVRAGSEITLGREELRAASGTTELEPFVVRAEAVQQMASVEVTDSRPKPFTGANVDLPRTIDDAQPYYIFDARVLEQSGAANLEDFLKERLTMNTTAMTNGQNAVNSTLGNLSSINLRGVGTSETLVLVDGRRMAGVYVPTNSATTYQPDLNGLPLSAIDRIEILPSSASGIYGGSAIGGVVNVILKKDFKGGELRASYDNTWDTDSPQRTMSASYGFSLEGGKTQVMLSGSWSDAKPLLLEDRQDLFRRNLATVLRNNPGILISGSGALLGALPNISPVSGTASLVLRNGTPLNARTTFVSAGISATTSSADLGAALLANAGSLNVDLPVTTQGPNGLLRSFGVTPETKSFRANFRREMFPHLELFADFSYSGDTTSSVRNPLTGAVSVPVSTAAKPSANPFTTAVWINFPDAEQVPYTTTSLSRSATLGAVVRLPREWTGEFDYTWSQSSFSSLVYSYDRTALTADLANGTVDPFVDTLRFPLALQKYNRPVTYAGTNDLNDFALRASGPLLTLPWGRPSLTLGLEHQLAHSPEEVDRVDYPISKASSYLIKYYERRSTTDSAYLESTVPLIKHDWFTGVHALDLQIAGRSERFRVDTGTPSEYDFYNQSPPSVSYSDPTQDGLPYYSQASYRSTNYTVGIKYRPIREVTIRASKASAFLPPTPDQLVKNPEPTPDGDTVDGNPVATISGGNPSLKPQTSKSTNLGLIWEPSWKPLAGLRLDAEYYQIEQFNAIDVLSAQQIVDLQASFPGRVTRDASGNITQVDTSYLNLYRRETDGWDLAADYSVPTSAGQFSLRLAESIILHLRSQYSPGGIESDAAGYSPDEGGSTKYKANGTLTWEWRRWTAGWTVRYFSSYKQYGAAGGPDSVQNYAGATDPYAGYVQAQGADHVASQAYHDLFVGYSWGHGPSGRSKPRAWAASPWSDLTLQFGIRNVFGKVPPFDADYNNTYFLSPYGDARLRTYWLSVRKEF